MWKFLRARGVDLPIAVIAFTTLAADAAWAGDPSPPSMPGPAAGGLAAAAIIGAIVIAKLWRRK